MGRPLVTKGDVARLVSGAIAGGLEPGTFEVRQEHGRLRLLPCLPVQPQGEGRPNSMDALLGT